MPDEIDTTVPHSPRVWNYWLGGKDNYEVDRQVGAHVMQTTPQIVDLARTSRGFLVRGVTYLVREHGVHQFLDIGTGLPTANNTHEVAQRAEPTSRIVYVDNDPIVLSHARALLTSDAAGATRYLDADFRDPQDVLAKAKEVGILDFDRPIALILMNIVGHVGDWDEAKRIVRTLVDALPPGSFLLESDGTNVVDPESLNRAAEIYNQAANPKYTLRTPEQLTELFDGLELVEPGVVTCPRWRPDYAKDVPGLDVGEPFDVDQFGGIGRKP